MDSREIGLTAVLALLVSAGCSKVTPPESSPLGTAPSADDGGGWQRVKESELTESQAVQRGRALAARDALMGSLKNRLTEVVSKDGYAAAITVCKEDAPRLAKEVSQQQGVTIGRTSFRLRNGANRPPMWAEALVADKVGEPAYLVREERLAALLPIPTGAMCLSCHGAPEGIPNDVLAALEEEYPEDRAIGFEEGDLRGWFWVEVGGL